MDPWSCVDTLSLGDENLRRQIALGYTCFPINHAAHKLLADQGIVEPLDHYEDIELGLSALTKRCGDEPEAVKQQLYSMYAQPLIRKQGF